MFGVTGVIGVTMLRRLWAVAHVALTLACLGCCAYLLWRERDREREVARGREREATRRPAVSDPALRQFHQVRWLGGDYELSPEWDHCGSAVLTFEDGRLTGVRHPRVCSIPPDGPRVVPYLVMWGPGPAGTRMATFSGWLAVSAERDDFFAKLDGPLMRSYGETDEGELRGYQVIGYAASREARAEQKKDAPGDRAVDLTLRSHRYVAVLGVKMFGSEEDARLWARQAIEEVDP